ncbi:class I SAM-dependent methyltransferase [Hyphobacterium sp.]|uniref:class I SAM-dependent methyltransferase n=1 Tax=Hyphobacterium sp. TaxID=2004662 RepID=UPI003BAAFA85
MTDAQIQEVKKIKEDKIKFALKEIEGWLWEDSAWLTAFLMEIQTKNVDLSNVSGAVEFGTYKGKYLSVIYTCLQEHSEVAIGYDIFTINTQEQLKENIKKANGESDRLFCFKGDTKRLNSDDILKALGKKPRFISVDAEHTFEGVYNDLLLSLQILGDGGIVAVDDFTNVHCPGVTEGAIAFLSSTHNLKLKPFVSCCNKLFITTESHYEIYFNEIEEFLCKNPDLNVSKYHTTRSDSQNKQKLCRADIHVLSHVKGANYHMKKAGS